MNPQPDPADSRERLQALARQGLEVVHQEFPNLIIHLMPAEFDARTPRERTPAFFGAFDWHSAVHTHWLLARTLRLLGDDELAPSIRGALNRSLTPENVAAELEFLSVRPSFEVPYGLAWLLMLAAELELHDTDWAQALEPMTELAVERLERAFLKLPFPIRTGEHNQTAFSMVLCLECEAELGLDGLARTIRTRCAELYGRDRDAPIAYEPSGYDFLSPALAEADAMGRCLSTTEYREWVDGFFGHEIDELRRWLQPCMSPDHADGKLAHLDGLNLSRAWMLESIASYLPSSHRLRATFSEAAATHLETGLRHAVTEHYMGSHWLGSFALLAISR